MCTDLEKPDCRHLTNYPIVSAGFMKPGCLPASVVVVGAYSGTNVVFKSHWLGMCWSKTSLLPTANLKYCFNLFTFTLIH
jgi:hypothetical protein